jgi:hypothetical protein
MTANGTSRRCPILIDLDGQLIKSALFASRAEEPVTISMMMREKGWKPIRVRFDEQQFAWIVRDERGMVAGTSARPK